MICGRGGGFRKGGKRSGRFATSQPDAIFRKTLYLVAPPRKKKKKPVKDASAPLVRVVLAQSDNTMAYLPDGDREGFAEGFVADLEDWTLRLRGERAMPQDICIDRYVSFSPSDNVDAERALAIARELVEKVMGPLDERVALFVVHGDTQHSHVHFLVSTVASDGRIFNPHHDDDLWIEAKLALEKTHQLRQVPLRAQSNRLFEQNGHKRPSCLSIRIALQYPTFFCSQNPAAFLKKLDDQGLQMIVHTEDGAAGEDIAGVSLYRDGETFTGAQLGAEFAWPALKQQIGYRPEHLSIIKNHSAAFEAQTRMSCTLRRDDDGGDPLPSKRQRPWRSVASGFVRKKMPLAAGDIFRWRRGDDDKTAFREVTQVEEGDGGMGAAILTTQNGINRSVVQGMLERAVQLGWKGIVAEGSKTFKELVTKIRTAWLDGKHIQDVLDGVRRPRAKKSVQKYEVPPPMGQPSAEAMISPQTLRLHLDTVGGDPSAGVSPRRVASESISIEEGASLDSDNNKNLTEPTQAVDSVQPAPEPRKSLKRRSAPENDGPSY